MRQETSTSDALREFYAQRPRWTAQPSENGAGAAEHATVEVPRDYTDPGGERITIALSRRLATRPERRRGVLLSVHGGPGGDWGLGRALADQFADTPVHEVHDLIGFDPRGTGESTNLHAEVAIPKAAFDSRPPDSAFEMIAEDMRSRELACERAGGELRRHVSTRNTARDMDVIRGVLGEEKINFVGYAYGSYVGAVYGSMFPAHLDRSVLDSCVHPDWTWHQQFLWQGDAIQRNVDQWARWTGERDSHFGLGTDPAQVLGAVEEVVAGLEAQHDSTYPRTLFDGTVGTSAANRGMWAELGVLVGDLRAATRADDPEKSLSLLSDKGTWRPSDSEGDLRPGVLDAVTLEHQWPADIEVYFDQMRDFRKRFPYGYGVLRAQPWVGAFRTFTAPEEPAALVRDGYPVGLVVQADGDPMDHYAGGVAMAERLGHHLITVDDSGEHEVYARCGNSDLDTIVHRYLVTGELPPPRTTCASATRRPDIPADSDRT
jgi:pimeloyl-ACP methyl ester carboxylesterase